MDQWEYTWTRIRIAQIAGKNSTYWEWVEDKIDGSLLQGMKIILNNYGSDGWELVNIVPEYWEGTAVQYASADVKTFCAVFKRKTNKDVK